MTLSVAFVGTLASGTDSFGAIIDPFDVEQMTTPAYTVQLLGAPVAGWDDRGVRPAAFGASQLSIGGGMVVAKWTQDTGHQRVSWHLNSGSRDLTEGNTLDAFELDLAVKRTADLFSVAIATTSRDGTHAVSRNRFVPTGSLETLVFPFSSFSNASALEDIYTIRVLLTPMGTDTPTATITRFETVPAPGSIALLLAAGTIAARRRRESTSRV